MTDKQALSFPSPEMPTSENFDQLLKRFGSASFSAEPDSWDMNPDTANPPDANETSRYEVNNDLINFLLGCSIKEKASVVCTCSSSGKDKLHFVFWTIWFL